MDAGIGGAHLNKEPKDISLLDIFLAVEEEEALFRFHANPNPACPVGRHVHDVLDDRLDAVSEAMRAQLSSVSLQALIEDLQNRLS